MISSPGIGCGTAAKDPFPDAFRFFIFSCCNCTPFSARTDVDKAARRLGLGAAEGRSSFDIWGMPTGKL